MIKQFVPSSASCKCDSYHNIAYVTCKAVSNEDIEDKQIVIKPGDIIKYRDHIDNRTIRFGTVSSIRAIEDHPSLARIHVMGDRPLTVMETICLVYIFVALVLKSMKQYSK